MRLLANLPDEQRALGRGGRARERADATLDAAKAVVRMGRERRAQLRPGARGKLAHRSPSF